MKRVQYRGKQNEISARMRIGAYRRVQHEMQYERVLREKSAT